MRKLLLLAAMPALGLTAFADDIPDPTIIDNTNAYYMSPNAEYMVSDGYVGMQILDLKTGERYDYTEGAIGGHYEPGIGRCISNNGIILSNSASYWKDGSWSRIKVPSFARYINLVNSITPDGTRICGSLGMNGMSTDDSDVLRQAPCIWNWDEVKGAFGDPVMLPRPELDFSGRVPQMITAVDISEDGKIIVGQIVTAMGTFIYPIIYRENAEGVWEYEIPDYDKLHPEGYVFPEFPSEQAPAVPQIESFMSEDELNAYLAALEAYNNSGYSTPYPEYEDFMTQEEINAYNDAVAKFNVEYEAWSSKFHRWYNAFWTLAARVPNCQYNSIRISPDGRNYVSTVLVEILGDSMDTDRVDSYIYMTDLQTKAVTKYEQMPNFCLSYFGNDGVALAVTGLQEESQSYVLSEGKCTDMRAWITSRIPQYDAWMEENMTQGIDVNIFNEETGEFETIYDERVLTGRACSTPDLSVITLGVTNVWDYLDEGYSYIFDMMAGNGVAAVSPAVGENAIYDLYGRRLKNVSAPGIYIVNGEKKVVH